jgi:ubiquinone/menaquinone biosynthesis C-methylase UbiE
MKNNNWKVWDKNSAYGDLFYKRATGELEEMESSKALCKVLSDFYREGMSLADIGCGGGHYLRSLRKRLDNKIDYTGVDPTEYYIDMARKAFPQDANFMIGDIFNLDLADDSFDIVMNNNVLLHLPPPPRKPLEELIRISRKYVVIRTVFGKRNYIIKEICDELNEVEQTIKPLNVMDDESQSNFNYFNMYTETYLRSILRDIDPDLKVQILDDKMWGYFDNTSLTNETGTRVFGEFQLSGNLLLDWKFIVITKA